MYGLYSSYSLSLSIPTSAQWPFAIFLCLSAVWVSFSLWP